MIIPLAEEFHSIQGEGHWVGTAMHFWRLPGCSVGKKVRKATFADANTAGKLHDDVVVGNIPYVTSFSGKSTPAWLCKRWDGRAFWCDTDFHKYSEMDFDDLFSQTWEEHICITGGEPLIHREVIDYILYNTNFHQLHIETSGTIQPWWSPSQFKHKVWLTVSPKEGYIPSVLTEADEVKLLIGKVTPTFPKEIELCANVYLSPINEVPWPGQTSASSLLVCRQLQETHPQWKINLQTHKFIGAR